MLEARVRSIPHPRLAVIGRRGPQLGNFSPFAGAGGEGRKKQNARHWRIDWEVARVDRVEGAARYILHLHMLTDPTTSPPTAVR